MLRYTDFGLQWCRSLWAGVVALLIVAPLSGALAEHIRKDGRLVCAVIDVPPFAVRDDAGRAGGLLVDMTTVIAGKAGFVCDIQLLPFTRAIQNTGSGDADMLILYPNPKVDAVTWRANIVLKTSNILLLRKGTDQSLMAVENAPLLGKMQTGFLNSVYEKQPGYDFHYLQNYHQGIRLLRRSRIDGLLAPEVAVAWELDKMEIDAAEFAAPARLNYLAAYLFVNKRYQNHPDGKRLVQAAQAFYESGEWQGMIDQYLPPSWQRSQ